MEGSLVLPVFCLVLLIMYEFMRSGKGRHGWFWGLEEGSLRSIPSFDINYLSNLRAGLHADKI